MTRQTFALHNAQQAWQVLRDAVWPLVKSLTMAEHRLTLTVAAEKRSDAQNRLLHAMISEIARTTPWAGAKREPETWKRLLVAAWSRENGVHLEVLPALDGHGIDLIPIRTSKLTKSQCAELVDWIQCYCANNGIAIHETRELAGN